MERYQQLLNLIRSRELHMMLVMLRVDDGPSAYRVLNKMDSRDEEDKQIIVDMATSETKYLLQETVSQAYCTGVWLLVGVVKDQQERQKRNIRNVVNKGKVPIIDILYHYNWGIKKLSSIFFFTVVLHNCPGMLSVPWVCKTV